MNTTSLIAPKIRQTFKKFFNGSAEDILAELLQNSQRAGATKIQIQIQPISNSKDRRYRFVYQDNGTGIRNIPDLLCLGSSNYSQKVKDQEPMGVGFMSLLANEAVLETVTVETLNTRLDIDVKKWWESDDYALSLIDSKHNTGKTEHIVGTKIECELTYKLGNAIEGHLRNQKGGIQTYYDPFLQRYHRPYEGYYLMGIEIWVNNKQLTYPDYSSSAIASQVLFESEYLGNRLVVFQSDLAIARPQQINWYGQMIPVDLPFQFSLLYEVKVGTPLNPLAPVRNSIIDDEKKERFVEFISQKLLDFFSSHNLESKYTPQNLTDYYHSLKVIKETKQKYCHWFVASKYIDETVPENGHCCATSKDEVFKIENAPIILKDDNVWVVNSNSKPPSKVADLKDLQIIEASVGLHTFVPIAEASLGQSLYSFRAGVKQRLKPAQSLYWLPGEKIDSPVESLFKQRGQWAIVANIPQLEKSPEINWHDVTDDVCAYEEISDYEFDEYSNHIGCLGDNLAEAFEQMYDFAFDYDNENSDRDSFNWSVNDIKARLNNGITEPFDIATIKNVLLREHPNLKREDIPSAGIIFKDYSSAEIFRVNETGVIDFRTKVNII